MSLSIANAIAVGKAKSGGDSPTPPHPPSPPIRIEWGGVVFHAVEDGTLKYVPSSVSSAEYSLDGENWLPFNNVEIAVSKGREVAVRAVITAAQSATNNSKFYGSGLYDLRGDLMSLVDGANYETSTKVFGFEFAYLFSQFNHIRHSREMYYDCIAIACATSQFAYMFSGCTQMETCIDRLQVKSGQSQFVNMMFQKCTSLTKGTYVRSTSNFGSSAYLTNFYNGCSSLNEIWMDVGASASLTPSGWLSGVASVGVLHKKSTFYITSGIPSGWTTDNNLTR